MVNKGLDRVEDSTVEDQRPRELDRSVFSIVKIYINPGGNIAASEYVP